MIARERERFEREPYPITEPDVSIGELVGRIGDDLGGLVRDHIHLARHEMIDEARKAGRAAGMLTAAALAAWLTVVVLSFALAWGLAVVFESIWLGFLVTALLWGVVAGIAGLVGRQRLREVEPMPEETIAELREDKEWLKDQMS